MSLIDRTLISFRYSAEIESFLNMLRDKTKRQNSDTAVFDELYGILPPTKTSLLKRSFFKVKWGLEDIMTVSNAWNNFAATLWYSGSHWYCVEMKFFEQGCIAEFEPFLNREAYQDIFALSSEALEFLNAGFTNLLLRHTAIRKYIAEQQGKTSSLIKRDLISEIFITLLNLKLHEDEHFDQDLFIRRAERTVYHIVGERAKYFTTPDCRELAKVCAVRGAYKVAEELYIPINLVWGFLVNDIFMDKEKNDGAIPFYFIENYYPHDKVEISPVHPASAKDKTGIAFRRTHDSYKQVFSDYETALSFRRSALEILEASKYRTVECKTSRAPCGRFSAFRIACMEKLKLITGGRKWRNQAFKK